MGTIKAIETEYDGYRFRSRLEARWAYFLRAMSIPYEYENEGFTDGREWYLPDFELESQKGRLFLEIKPNFIEGVELRKIEMLAHKYPVVVACGGIRTWRDGYPKPLVTLGVLRFEQDRAEWISACFDACTQCGVPLIRDTEGKGIIYELRRPRSNCQHLEMQGLGSLAESVEVNSALLCAKKARFEFRESHP